MQQIASHRKIDDRSRFGSLRLERANVQKECEDLLLETAKIRKRLAELRKYKDSVEAERSRLKRTRTAGSHFLDFKVTHCPVCEHAVKEPEEESDTCYLCGNSYEFADPATSNARIEFELDQLQEEIDELNQLIDKSSEDLRSKENSHEALRTALLRIDADLAPAIHSTAEILPPELSIIDVTIGRLNEQREQVARVEKNLITQAELDRKIAENASEIERLRACLKSRMRGHVIVGVMTISTDVDKLLSTGHRAAQSRGGSEGELPASTGAISQQRSGTGSSGDQAPDTRKPAFSLVLGSLAHDRRLRSDPYDPQRPGVRKRPSCEGRSTPLLHSWLFSAVTV